MRAICLLFTLGSMACGDGGASIDATPPVDAREPDFSCASEELPESVPDPIELSGMVYEPGLTGSSRDRPIERATVGAWNPERTFLMLARLTDAAGEYSLTLPTDGVPLPMLLEVKAPLMRTSIAWLPTDTFEPRDDIVVALFTTEHVDSIMNFAGIEPDPAKGVLLVKAFDCEGVAMEGVTITSEPPPLDTLYVGDSGLPRYEAPTTGQGTAILLDVPAGPVTIRAELNGVQLRASTIEVETLGKSITTAAIVP